MRKDSSIKTRQTDQPLVTADSDSTPYTAALYAWFTSMVGPSNSIQLSADKTHSILKFESTLPGIEFNEGDATEDKIDVDNVIEIFEESGLISLYIYIKTELSEEVAARIGIELMNVNQRLPFGHFEVYSTREDHRHFLRYRSSMYVRSIRANLVEVIDDLFNNSSEHCVQGLNMIGNT